MSDDLHRQYHSITDLVVAARKDCEKKYRVWKLATRELFLLERQQTEIFSKIVCAGDSVTEALPKAQKDL